MRPVVGQPIGVAAAGVAGEMADRVVGVAVGARALSIAARKCTKDYDSA